MRLLLLVALSLPNVAVAQGIELRNEDRAYFEECEGARRIFLQVAARDMKEQRQLIAKTKSARFGSGARKGKAGAYDFPTKEAKDEALDLYESTLEQMERLVELVDKKERIVAPKRSAAHAWPKEAQVWPVGLETGTAVLTVYENRDSSPPPKIRWAVGMDRAKIAKAIRDRKLNPRQLDQVSSGKAPDEKYVEAFVENGKTTAVAQGMDPKDAMQLWRMYQAERKKAGLK